MFMCSSVNSMCLDPHPLSYHNSHYDCLQAGYEEATNKLTEIGKEETNKHEIYIKFTCMWEKVNEV